MSATEYTAVQSDDRHDAIRAVGDQVAQHLVSCASARLSGWPDEALMAADRAYGALAGLSYDDLMWLAVDTICQTDTDPKPRELRLIRDPDDLAERLVQHIWPEVEAEARALLAEMRDAHYVDEIAQPHRPERSAP